MLLEMHYNTNTLIADLEGVWQLQLMELFVNVICAVEMIQVLICHTFLLFC